MNSIVLTGNITKDIELKQTNSGKSYANFTLAVKRKMAKEGEQQTDFIYIQTWGKTAENCSNYLNKGSKILVQGELRIDQLNDASGEQKTYTKVNALNVEFLDTKNKENTNINTNINTNNLNFDSIDDDDIPF